MNILNKYILGCLFVCFLQVAALYLTLELCPGRQIQTPGILAHAPASLSKKKHLTFGMSRL